MKKYKNIYYILSILTSIAVVIWDGTIYIFMHKIGYSYSQINLFLSIFWIVTFFTEIPSGYIADHIGYLKTLSISGFIRAFGLLILALSSKNLFILIMSGVFTALGDSLQSGTLTSWLSNRAKLENDMDSLNHIYSTLGIITNPLNMLIGFLGANVLANFSLNLPIIIGAVLFIINGILSLFLIKYDKSNRNVQRPKFDIINDFKTIKQSDFNALRLIIVFIPVIMISVAPLDQWQLFFQHGKKIMTGYIVVLMGIMGTLASYLYSRLIYKIKNEWKLFIISTVMMALTIIATTLFKQYYLMSLGIFLMNVLFGSLEGTAQNVYFQKAINNETTRATIVSIYNAVEAGVTVVVLGINGYLADRYGLGIAWMVLAILGLIFFVTILGLNRKLLINKKYQNEVVD
ncbi:MFS transporter [Lactobacillus sp. PSON]|uniref:MFS transporter n=1 Tax=Lactobacillus sp. PSON TaxID=3455454 RepID=UPI0040416C38